MIALLLGLLPVPKFLRKLHLDVAVQCSRRKFCCEFFTQMSEYFRASFGLHGANHFDFGIIGKTFSSCKIDLSIEDAKCHDVRRGTKANALDGRFLTKQ